MKNKTAEGTDFMTMAYEQRAIDIDKLQVPTGQVVTGVRFRKLGTHLNFEIQVSFFFKFPFKK